MSTIELYNILIDQGVERDKAQKAVDAFLTREEAKETLATKADLQLVKADLYRVALIQTGAIIAALTGILALFF